jgi:hypothetical protein
VLTGTERISSPPAEKSAEQRPARRSHPLRLALVGAALAAMAIAVIALRPRRALEPPAVPMPLTHVEVTTPAAAHADGPGDVPPALTATAASALNGHPRRATRPSHAPAVQHTSPRTDCDPPFRVAADGRRVPRPECF